MLYLQPNFKSTTMKKLIYPVLAIFITLGTFQSCSNDDDNGGGDIVNNQISINGTVYNFVATGTLESYGENTDGSFDWDVTLATENAVVSVYFDLNTDSETGLSEGTYNYSNERQAFTYVDAYIEVIENSEFIDYEPTEGTIVIDINGDNVTITFNLTEGSNSIQGSWTGSLISIED